MAIRTNRQRISLLFPRAKWALGIGMLPILLQVSGFLDIFDYWHRSKVAQFLAKAPRDSLPVLIGLDTGLAESWGPPPWRADKWQILAKKLHSAGVKSATLVTRPSLVFLPKKPASEKAGASGNIPESDTAKILVPRFLVSGGTEHRMLMSDQLDNPENPLTPLNRHIYLHPSDHGVIRDAGSSARNISQFGRSAFCEMAGSCPKKMLMGTPLRPGGIPVISASDWLNKNNTLDISQRQILVGLTAPRFAPTFVTGPEDHLVSEAEAIVRIVAALSLPAHKSLSPLSAALFILIWSFFITFFITAFIKDSRISMLLSGFLALLTGSLVYQSGWAALPTTAMVLTGLLPGISLLLISETNAKKFMSGARRIILREAFRHTPKASLIRSHEELFRKLAAFSRNYFYSESCGWFRFDLHSQSFSLEGAYGFKPGDLKPSSMDTLRKSLRSPLSGTLVSGFFKEDAKGCRLVPLHIQGHPLGVWCLPYDQEPPAAERIGHLLSWLIPRIAMAKEKKWMVWTSVIDHMSFELRRISSLLHSASDERSRQHQILTGLPSPIVMADLTGSVLFVNNALGSLLLNSEIGVVNTVREIFFKLCPTPEEASAADHRLFKGGKQVHLILKIDNRTYHANFKPLLSEDTGDQTEVLIGYVGIFLDVTVSEQLEQVRSSMAAVLENQVRNSLMSAQGFLEAAIDSLSDDHPEKGYLMHVDGSLKEIAQAVDDVNLEISPEDSARELVPINLVDMIQSVILEMDSVLHEKKQSVEFNTPDLPQPVKLRPILAQTGIRSLLELFRMHGPQGGRLTISIQEGLKVSKFSVKFFGPGLDETMFHCKGSGTETERLIGRVREAFPDVTMSGGPGLPTEFICPVDLA